jgi:hypothetical protein
MAAMAVSIVHGCGSEGADVAVVTVVQLQWCNRENSWQKKTSQYDMAQSVHTQKKNPSFQEHGGTGMAAMVVSVVVWPLW